MEYQGVIQTKAFFEGMKDITEMIEKLETEAALLRELAGMGVKKVIQDPNDEDTQYIVTENLAIVRQYKEQIHWEYEYDDCPGDRHSIDTDGEPAES